MKIKTIIDFLDNILKPNQFFGIDLSMNGVQVGQTNQEVKGICFAVDVCFDSIEQTIKNGANLLVVHHGLFWGQPIPVINIHYDRIKALIDNNITLYACHLPLDAHKEFGNNIQIAKTLRLNNIESFLDCSGINIGYKGTLPEELTADEIANEIANVSSGCLKQILNFGKEKIQTIGICSGSASSDVKQAIDLGLDAFVSGDCKHEIYHLCKEHKMNLIGLGHYCTETFGVKALKYLINDTYKINTTFIDIPTML